MYAEFVVPSFTSAESTCYQILFSTPIGTLHNLWGNFFYTVPIVAGNFVTSGNSVPLLYIDKYENLDISLIFISYI
jgi:hypothetical protein